MWTMHNLYRLYNTTGGCKSFRLKCRCIGGTCLKVWLSCISIRTIDFW